MSTDEGGRNLVRISLIVGIGASLVAILSFLGIESVQDIRRRPTSASQPAATQPTATQPPPTTRSAATESPSTTRSPRDTQDDRPTRRQYLKAADEICAKWFHEAAVVARTVSDEYERFVRILQIHDSLLLDWGALQPPQGDSARVDAILDGYRAGNREAFAAAEALQAGDDGRYQAAKTRAQGYDAAAGRRAAAYGLRVCSQLGA